MSLFQKILVPLDGSSFAEKALHPALVLSRAMNSALVLIRTVTPLPVFAENSLEETAIRGNYNEAISYLETVAANLRAQQPEIIFEIVIGSAAKVIIDYARDHEIDLIIMSNFGSSGPSRWFLGSVAKRVLRKSPCTTIVIKVQAGVELFSSRRILVPLDGSL